MSAAPRCKTATGTAAASTACTNVLFSLTKLAKLDEIGCQKTIATCRQNPRRNGMAICDRSSNLHTPLIFVRPFPGDPNASPLTAIVSGTIARVPSPLAHRSTSSTITAPRHAICTAVTGAEANRLNARHS